MKNFPSPHVHPQSLDSASTLEAFAERELQLDTSCLTVTDHGTLGGCRRAYDLCAPGGKYHGQLFPVLGLEGYFRPTECNILKAAGIEKKNDSYAHYLKYCHLTFHALNEAAFHTLGRVLSRTWLDPTRVEKHGSERKPLFNWADLEELGGADIVFGSGCLIGAVARHLQVGQPKIALEYYKRLRSLVRPGNWVVEVFPHECSTYWQSGVFLKLEGESHETKVYLGKKLRTDKGEFTAEELARLAERGSDPGRLLAIKDYSKWTERPPVRILGVRKVEDFIKNECTPWAPDADYQRGANLFMLGLARRFGDPVVISDDSHFAVPEEKVVQDVRLTSSGGSWKMSASYHRQSSEEAFSYFRDHMGISPLEFEQWVENNRNWATRFRDFVFSPRKSLPTRFYPEDTLRHTMALIKRHGRMDWGKPNYVVRLKQEIELLHRNGTLDLLPYFMIDEELVSLYEQQGLLTGPGRGSAAGVLLTYLLGITHVDPLKYGLSLDRFLTLDRICSGKLPDIDQDLPSTELATQWLRDRFGDCHARISTNTTLKVKYAIKDVFRAMHGVVPGVIEGLTKKMKQPPQGVDDGDYVFGYEGPDGQHVPGATEHDPALKDFIRWYPKEWEIVQKCLGLTRTRSQHPCGIVIANEPVANFLPLTMVGDVPCTDYTASSVEAAGGLKMDFLRVNSLNDISLAIRLIRNRKGLAAQTQDYTIDGKRVPWIRAVPLKDEFVDIWDLPEDIDVFNDIVEGRSETVFQFNTPSAVQWLKEFSHEVGTSPAGQSIKAIHSLMGLAAFTALDRPGPLDAMVASPDGTQHNMLVEYARRSRGEEPFGTLPIFQEYLPETFGIMCFQEQLQRMYQVLTGCSGPEAEEFRSNVAKKKMEKVLKAQPFFVEKAALKIGEQAAKDLFEAFKTWASYGFNMSHAVSYSAIGYACAFLKHYYPLEWWTAVLTNASKNEINEKFWRYCGHLIDMPDIRLSTENFEIVGDRIRAPFWLLHGVGEGAQEELAAGRPYIDIVDFCRKIYQTKLTKTKAVEKTDKTTGEKSAGTRMGTSALNRGVCYRLIVSGAMDSLFPADTNLLDMFAQYEKAIAETAVEVLGKPKKPKILPVDPTYIDINQITRYQLRKSILPAYSGSLLKPFIERQVPNIVVQDRRALYDYKGDLVPFKTAGALELLDQVYPWPDGQRTLVACAAYIVGARSFFYGPEKEKRALELDFDINGGRYRAVKWPSKKGLPTHFTEALKGSVGVAIFVKYSERPFSLDEFVVVQSALTETAEG